jgi:hypothetical protein
MDPERPVKNDNRTYRLNGITPPVGTLLGPDPSGQGAVVVETDDTGCTVRAATQDDRDAMIARVLRTKEVHSSTEGREFWAWWASVAATVYGSNRG